MIAREEKECGMLKSRDRTAYQESCRRRAINPALKRLPPEPVIWAENHGFKDDVAASFAAAWEGIARIGKVTRDNAAHIAHASVAVQEWREQDFQRRF